MSKKGRKNLVGPRDVVSSTPRARKNSRKVPVGKETCARIFLKAEEKKCPGETRDGGEPVKDGSLFKATKGRGVISWRRKPKGTGRGAGKKT